MHQHTTHHTSIPRALAVYVVTCGRETRLLLGKYDIPLSIHKLHHPSQTSLEQGVPLQTELHSMWGSCYTQTFWWPQGMHFMQYKKLNKRNPKISISLRIEKGFRDGLKCSSFTSRRSKETREMSLPSFSSYHPIPKFDFYMGWW